MSAYEEHWNYNIDLNAIALNSCNDFQTRVKCLHQHMLNLLEDRCKVQKCNFSRSIAQSNDDDLKILAESNRQLRNDIENKIANLSKQKALYESRKKDQELLCQEIKETHEAFLMTKKFYKKYLKIYYTVESRNADSQTIFLQFFTEAKKETENYSIRLCRNTKTGLYELSSVTPKVKNLKDLQKQLAEFNDVPGVLCCIRQYFINIKNK